MRDPRLLIDRFNREAERLISAGVLEKDGELMTAWAGLELKLELVLELVQAFTKSPEAPNNIAPSPTPNNSAAVMMTPAMWEALSKFEGTHPATAGMLGVSTGVLSSLVRRGFVDSYYDQELNKTLYRVTQLGVDARG